MGRFMKKLVYVGIAAITVVLLLLLSERVLSGNATEQSEEFRMDKDVLVQYNGSNEEVVVPDDVVIIGEEAFRGNHSIKKVVLPEGLETVSYAAFSDCTSLEEIQIPDSVLTIGASAFANCTALKGCAIGKGLTQIGSGVFAGCTSLSEIDMDIENKDFTFLQGALYSADRKILYQYMPGRNENYFVMNSRVEQIEQYAFWGSEQLKHINVSAELEQIDDYAFANCTQLCSVNMSYAVKSIGIKAFEDCSSLEQIFIPNSVSKIHETAFDGCETVQFLAEDGFYASQYAKEHQIPILEHDIYATDIADKLSEEDARRKDTEIMTIATTPDASTVTDKNVGRANVDNPNPILAQTNVVADHAVLFMDNTTQEVVTGEADSDRNRILKKSESGKIPDSAFYQDKELTEADISKEITSIGEFAFARSQVVSATLGDGVTSIGKGAFYHCDLLQDVSIPTSVTEIGENAFDKTPWMEQWYQTSTDDYLVVGDGVLIAYKCPDGEFELPADVKKVACKIPEDGQQ